MNEEIRMILNMLEEGSISAEEAEKLIKLIGAVSGKDSGVTADDSGEEGARNPVNPKKVTITVKDREIDRVNVSIPFSLLRTGLKLGLAAGALGANYVKNEDEAILLETLKSIDVDELLSAIADSDITLPYNLVDIDDATGRNVRIILS